MQGLCYTEFAVQTLVGKQQKNQSTIRANRSQATAAGWFIRMPQVFIVFVRRFIKPNLFINLFECQIDFYQWHSDAPANPTIVCAARSFRWNCSILFFYSVCGY